jgi:diguanylate cyclase (GGDEF)-like protein
MILQKFSSVLSANGAPSMVVLGATTAAMAITVLALTGVLGVQLHRSSAEGYTLSAVALALSLVMIFAWGVCILLGMAERSQTNNAKEQTDELFAMTDMLQSADGYEDAAAVLRATAERLLPTLGVALYVFNNSRDRLDLTGSWNMPEDYSASETLSPSNCWTLKRGKAHINVAAPGTLCCAHHAGSAATLELPMMARGSVYGLLVLSTAADRRTRAKLTEISRLGQALADSMSLALSNISLREKLRTQSLRDPLTGLYNRRYMEDALERFVSLGERTGTSTAVLMLDLDNFKRLNDEYGHAKGDAVLRDVAAQLIGGLRPSDVICRYGGEELMVILPDCSLDDAKLKAETLRVRIEGLSDMHDAAITVSIGIAAIPETSTSMADIVPMADAALYSAKGQGKNRVVCADCRAAREDIGPRLSIIPERSALTKATT